MCTLLLADIVSLSSGADVMCRAWDHETGKQLSIYSMPGLGPRRKAPQKGMSVETAPDEAETAAKEHNGLREPSTASTVMPDAAQPQEDSAAFCNGADAEASADEQVGKAGCACYVLLLNSNKLAVCDGLDRQHKRERGPAYDTYSEARAYTCQSHCCSVRMQY